MSRHLAFLGLFILLSSTPAGAATLTVPAGGNFQTALTNALPGDTIVLQAGASYPTGGGFVLPNKGAGTQVITIQSSALSSLPAAGYRVHPSDASHMPKLVTTANGAAVVTAAQGAHHYKFIGIEFAVSAGMWSYGMVRIGEGDETTLSQIPYNFVFDRCYVHGDPTATPGTKRGFQLNGSSVTVMNSYVSDIHVIGQDNQAVGGWSGPGPFTIVNNYLEASSENILFGGAHTPIANTVPSDIIVRYNHLYKPRSWQVSSPSYGGIHWSVKNSFELKNARRVIVEGNVFENCWSDAQVGFAFQLTPRVQNNNPWATVEDVTITHNIVRHVASGINMLSEDDNGSSDVMKRMVIRDNLIEDVNPDEFGGDGRIFQFLAPNRPIQGVAIEHNTALHGPGGGNSFADAGGRGINADQLRFNNNLVTHASYGFFSGTEGISVLNTFFTNYTFDKNAIIGGGTAAQYPNNFLAANPASVGFVNFIGGDYRLTATSPYHHAGTDGKDVGADIPAVIAATCGAVSGVPQASCASAILPPPPITSACDINQDGGTTVVDVQLMANQALGMASCSVDLNRDGRCTVVDVQKVVNSVLGKGCIVP